MVKCKFFVHCSGWRTGGYHNTHYFKNAEDAKKQVEIWNLGYVEHGNTARVEIVSLEEVTYEEFSADYMGE